MVLKRDFSALPRNDIQKPRGSVLITALWVLAFLSVLSLSLSAQASLQIRGAGRVQRRIQATQIAWGNLGEAIARLRKESQQASPTGLGVQGPGVRIAEDRFEIQEEEGKLSVNTAPAPILAALIMEVGGLSPAAASEVAEAIVDWRDPDDLPEPNGAESATYQGLPSPYPCRNAPLESVEELLLIRGVTYELHQKLKGCVTVWGKGRVSLNSAPPEVFKALGMSQGVAERILSYRQGPDGILKTEDDVLFGSVGSFPSELQRTVGLTPEQFSEASAFAASDLLTVNPGFFEIRAFGQVPKDPKARQIRSVVDSSGRILAWHEE